jgi:hypothetical protein
MAILTQEQAAEVIGISTRRLQQILRAGDGPVVKASGQFEAREIGVWYRARIMSELGVAGDGQAYDYDAERGRLTKAQADKTELEAAELAGRLVRVDDIETEWGRMLGAIRARLLSLPTKAAPTARASVNDDEAAALIEAEVLEALQELSSDGIPQATRERRGRQPEDAAGPETASEVDREPMGGPVPTTKRRKLGGAGAVAD